MTFMVAPTCSSTNRVVTRSSQLPSAAVLGSVHYNSLYAVGMTLFIMTLLMNLLSAVILRRFREVYQ